jgi:hypothetical protein
VADGGEGRPVVDPAQAVVDTAAWPPAQQPRLPEPPSAAAPTATTTSPAVSPAYPHFDDEATHDADRRLTGRAVNRDNGYSPFGTAAGLGDI